jgi:DNA-binding MarR family transcriptional regulator
MKENKSVCSHCNARDISILLWRIIKIWRRKQLRSLDPYGLTPSQLEVLGTLYISKVEEIMQITLSRVTFIDPMTISTIIKNMEKKELVKRSKSNTDMRAISISITEKGIELMERLKKDESLFFAENYKYKDIDKDAIKKQMEILLDVITG